MNKLFSFLLFIFLSTGLLANQNDKIKVLIIDGYSNHDWSYTTEVIKSLLIHSGFCEIDISTAPANNDPDYLRWNPDFSKYNVVIQNVNSLGNGNTWPEKVRFSFENYIKQGGGMYVFHSANNSFPEWEEYNKMIGLGWRAHDQGHSIEIIDNKMVRINSGTGQRTSHGPRLDLVVKILKDHPINQGFPDEWKTPDIELYTYARGPALNIDVLSYAYDNKTGMNWPVDWVVQYGKGRIYNATYGHLWHDERMPQSIQCVGFQTSFLRAIQWLARRKVTVKIPEKFPTRNEIVLNPVELIYEEEDGWQSLFNGINLDGWKIVCRKEDEGKQFWKAENGTIECNSIGKPDHNYVWLMSNEEFKDFQLRLNFQAFKESKGNSGVQFRSRYEPEAKNGGLLNGPQIDIHPPIPFRTGLIYDETDGVNRWIYPSMKSWGIAEKDVPETALKNVLVYADDDKDAWNSMELICKGMKIRTFINGREISVFDGTGILDDSLHQQKNVGRKGKIALQLHASDELLIKYKNLFIRNY